jgi:hypothetical protein
MTMLSSVRIRGVGLRGPEHQRSNSNKALKPILKP